MAEDKDLKIIIPPEIQAQMDADPEMAKGLREMFAAMRQAHQAISEGRYDSFDDAMEAITGQRPTLVNDGDDDEEE